MSGGGPPQRGGCAEEEASRLRGRERVGRHQSEERAVGSRGSGKSVLRKKETKIDSKTKNRRLSRESVQSLRKGTRWKSSSVKKERAVVAKGAKQLRENAQSARTTVKETRTSYETDRISTITSV